MTVNILPKDKALNPDPDKGIFLNPDPDAVDGKGFNFGAGSRPRVFIS